MKPILLIAPIAAAGVAVFAFNACQRETPPAPAAAQPAQVPFPPPKAKTEPGDPLDIFNNESAPRVRFKPQEQELAFVEYSEGLPKSGTWRGYPLLHDFNRDGRTDLVASNREEDGFSCWLAPVKGPWVLCNDGPKKDVGGIPRDMQYGPSRAADIDADGDDDLLVSAHKDALRLFRNVPAVDASDAPAPDGKLHWLESTPAPENPYLLIDLAIGNIDGDAFPDVAAIGHFKGGIAVYLGDGKGGMRRLPESAQIINPSTFGQHVDLVDIDGDGIDDIVSSTNRGLKVFVTKRTDGGFQWQDRSAGLPAPKIGNSISGQAVGHFLGGKTVQIATCLVPDPTIKPEALDSLGLYGWNEAKQTWEHVDRGLRRNEVYRELGAADLNADGHLDLVTLSLESGAVVYLGDGAGGFTPKGRLPSIFGVGRLAFGDMDADGLTDLLVSIPATKDRPEMGGLRAMLNKRELWK